MLTKRDMQNMQSGGARGLELRTSALKTATFSRGGSIPLFQNRSDTNNSEYQTIPIRYQGFFSQFRISIPQCVLN